ncbi:alpha carbonic anhydrase 1, chloroplastic isoform X1 [Coffea arabica]|uniref:Carbonic anhydrase n=2 Tax=Coffea arabica TaxID=13443 RepID=A0A6P6SVG0_COFAR|nr:alpha carbonic anhydrase 1, chloroplastic-like isoform X1 [Coffea arabica]
MAAATMPAGFAIFVLATTVLIIIHASPIFGEEAIVQIPFSYMGATGPSKWGSLKPGFSECSTGKSQSPIDIRKGKVVLNKKLKPLTREYSYINATFVNNGFNIGLRCGKNTNLLISDGKAYKFSQLHWHSPSEHRIDGVQYDAELHLVHIADDGCIAVIGILYHLGHPDPLIAKVQNKLYQLAKDMSGVKEGGQVALGTFNMHQLRKNARKYYRYSGSLTTPPCNQTVAWYILGKVRPISPEQVQALKAPLGWAYKNNSRPVQPLNGRLVELYEEVIPVLNLNPF